ncbi:MAG: hypothetical protein JST86_13925 [Bacteroidetes bacterium]|nr:hypothetical protein [Bacteroidota bacterium]
MKKFLPIIVLAVGLLMAFNRPIMGLIAPAELDIKISNPPVIMPSIYKVYANSDALNGKYSLFKMVIKNTSDRPAKNVEVSYSVSNFIDNTVAEKIPVIEPGQSYVVNCYPSFPDKIVDKMTDSRETVKTIVKGSNIKTSENSFPIPVRSRNAFMYNFMNGDEIRTSAEYFDNMPLLSCLVTPNDPIIKYLTQQIQEKVLKGDQASVSNKPEDAIRFVQGIYYATLVSHMVYSGTSGVPESISDTKSIVQDIRLPREVITGKTGLCIELSLLYASIMACEGMDAEIFLVPGHAFPGFYLNGYHYAIESTAIGGEGLGGRSNPEEAFKAGMKELGEYWPKLSTGSGGCSVINIRECQKAGAVAMELKDDNFLRQKIDEIARSFDPQNAQINVQNNNGVNGGGNVDNGGNGGGNDGGDENGGGGNGGGGNLPNGYRMVQDVVTFAMPSSWHQVPRSQYTVPQSRYVFANKNNNADVEVYSFPGYNNPEQALVSINRWVNQFGYSLQYQSTGQARGYTVYNGQTTSGNAGITWMAAFKATGSGVVGIAVGANMNTGTTYHQTISTILNTLQ